jgi:putative multiple sugar transport system permease protein
MTDISTPQVKPDFMRFLRSNIRDYALLLSLLAIMVFFQYNTNGTLFKPVNMTNLLLQNSYIVVMALGMLLVIVAGHIDLSVGSVSGFVGAVAAVLMTGTSPNPDLFTIPKLDFVTSSIICLAIGAAIGAVQGYFIAYYKIPAFIVTLAGMLIFKGLALSVLGGASVGPLPPTFQLLSTGFLTDVFGIQLFGAPFNLLALVIGTFINCNMVWRKNLRLFSMVVIF